MTNMQPYLAIGIPALLTLSNTAVMLYMFSGIKDKEQFAGVNRRLLAIEADLRQFYSITGAHTEAIETLKKRS